MIGREPMYALYLGVGLCLYVLPALVGSPSTLVFVALCAVITSFYGGGFATVPAVGFVANLLIRPVVVRHSDVSAVERHGDRITARQAAASTRGGYE